MAERVSDNIDVILEKRKKLEQAISPYLQNAYCTAFNQDDLMSLVDEGLSVIYLYGDEFTIPHDRENISYVGILKKPLVHCAVYDRSELDEKKIFVSNSVLCLSYENCIVDILKGKSVWNIGAIKNPSAEVKEDVAQIFCGIGCDNVRYLEIDPSRTFGTAFTDGSFVLMIQGCARQFFYDEIVEITSPQINDNKYIHIDFTNGTSYTTDAIPTEMHLSFDDMITLLRTYVEIAQGKMNESD